MWDKLRISIVTHVYRYYRLFDSTFLFSLALITNLREVQRALRLEEKYSANLSAVFFDHRPSDVSILARDGAVNTMRYMKVWFDLPEDVWFIAVNLLDRFLTRMKVQERFLACLIVSCLHVAASLRKINLDPQKLVTISQSKCSVKDLERMSDIVKQKLGIEDSELPITVLDFLYMFMKVMDSVVPERFRIKPVYENLAKKEFLVKRLEVVMANSVCASYRPTIVALSLLQTDIEFTYDSCIPSGYVYYSIEALHMLSCILNLQPMCKVSGKGEVFSLRLMFCHFRFCLWTFFLATGKSFIYWKSMTITARSVTVRNVNGSDSLFAQ